MPAKKPKSVRGAHFSWVLRLRNGIWQADGRSNTIDAGRHSLGVADYDEAVKELMLLDQLRAEQLGLIPKSSVTISPIARLLIADGFKLHDEYLGRARAVGGVKKSTRRRCKARAKKFQMFCEAQRFQYWDQVREQILEAYAMHLEEKGLHQTTITLELKFLLKVARWLQKEGHVHREKPWQMSITRFESRSAYCYRTEEVAAMILHCRSNPELGWLADLIVGLACTGMRATEIADFKTADIDWKNNNLVLSDESSRPKQGRVVVRELKTGRSRSIRIHPDLFVILEQHRHRSGFVFRGPRGGKLDLPWLRKQFVDLVINPLKAKFPTPPGGKGFADGRLHSFRHYYTSACVRAGIPVFEIMAALGHRSSEMTRHYFHVENEAAQRKLEGVDFLGAASGRSASEPLVNHEVEEAEPPVRDSDSSSGT